MSSILPHLNFFNKNDLALVLKSSGLPTDNFLALDEDFGMAFLKLYLPHVLLTLSED